MITEPVLLPPRGRLRPTGRVDYIEHYYRGCLAVPLRQRLRWAREALPTGHCGSLLEIGYGSGVFFYEAVRHADQVLGIDVHPWADDVRRSCSVDGIAVTTIQGDGCAIPLADSSIDVVVIISALEFMDDPTRCLRESIRLIRPGGRVIAVTARAHTWSDAVWRALAGGHPEAEFRGGRERVAQALASAERRRVGVRIGRYPRPRPLPRALAPYELVVIEHPSRRRDRRARPRAGDAALGVDVQRAM
jgi:SAM-dependent methyltransferase